MSVVCPIQGFLRASGMGWCSFNCESGSGASLGVSSVMASDWQVAAVMRGWLPLTGGVYVQGRLRCVSLVMVARVAVCMC